MKNFFFLISVFSFLFVCNSVTAQLYVANNSNYYVYVADDYLFVNQEVNLQGAGNLYLRNESQLLQGVGTTVSGNRGTGKLSVFQEGTANNFTYNYWCSPVGNASAAIGNEAFGITMFNSPSGLITSTAALTTAGINGTASPLTISAYWIWKFLSNSEYADWIFAGSGSTINAGEGFTMKGVAGTDATTVLGVQNNPGDSQRYDFRGKPNDGDIDIALLTDQTTLTGNPYPSAINLNMFLTDASNLTKSDGVAYFWEQSGVTSHNLSQYLGGYGSYVGNASVGSPGTYIAATWDTYNGDGSLNTTGGSTGSSYKRMFCPVGQGFMIDGTADGNVQMKNSFRVAVKEGVANNSEFNRKANLKNNDEYWGEIPNTAKMDYTQYSKEELPQIKIHTTFNDISTREIALAFSVDSTDGYDLGKDAKSPDEKAIDAYFPLVDTSKEYLISTLPFEENKKIPLALKCDKTTLFKVTVGLLVNYDLSENIFIFDKLTGEYHDIKNNFFEVSLDETATDRFEITFKDASLSTVDADLLESFSIYQNNDLDKLVISNPKSLDLKSCGVYDIAGKLIFGKQKLGNNTEYSFPTASLSDGIYIVKLKTKENLEIGKKVIVTRK